MNDESTVSDAEYRRRFDLYRMVYETRNLELNLFWQRANYFLALNTAIAIGYFAINPENLLYRLLLCGFGIVVGILWIRTNLGSKFWQARWENRLIRAELELEPPMRLFSDGWDSIYADAKEALENRRKGRIDGIINRAAMKKPSVTRTMIALSVVAFVFWIAASSLVLFPVDSGIVQNSQSSGEQPISTESITDDP